MTRIAIAAILLSATTAAAHNHWSDLDGDGLLEPDEFNLEDATFQDLDGNNDNVISMDEYDAYYLNRIRDDEVAIPQEVLPGDSGLVDDTATDISPRILSVGD